MLEGVDAFECNFELEWIAQSSRVIQHLNICNIDDAHLQNILFRKVSV